MARSASGMNGSGSGHKSVKFYFLNVKPHNNLLIQNSNCGINLSVNNVLKF